MAKKQKTILVINTGPIEDTIVSSPVCIELKRNYPDSNLVFICSERGKEVASCIPGVDEVITCERYGKDSSLNLFKMALSIFLKKRPYIAVVLNDTFRDALISFLTGAKKRAGRSCDGRDFLLTHRVHFMEEEKNEQVHITEYYMRILKPLKLYNPDYEMGFKYAKEDKLYIDNILMENNCVNKEIIAFCPISAREFKDWSLEESKSFIQIINRNPDQKIVIVGTERSKEFVDKLKQDGVDNFIDLTCKTTMTQLGALLDKSRVFVSVDSAPMHLGLALNIPTVALFFQENYKKWGPKDLDRNRLLIAQEGIIKAEQVIEAINSLKDSYNEDCIYN